MGKKAKEWTKGRRGSRRSRDAQMVDEGDEQPGSRQQNEEKQRKKQNHKKIYNQISDDEDEDILLQKLLSEQGLEWMEMNSDGNCLFSSLSDQLSGDRGLKHQIIRTQICDFMEENKEYFQAFLVFEDKHDQAQQEEDAKDFEHYIELMRETGTWGGNLELMAAARLYSRNIKVFQAKLPAYVIEHDNPNIRRPDILLSFHDENHYNSVRNPKCPPRRMKLENFSREEDESDQRATGDDPPTGQDMKRPDPPATISSRGENRISPTLIETYMEKLKLSTGKPTSKNVPCPCGSGKAHKKCCRTKDKRATRQERLKSNNLEAKNGDDAEHMDTRNTQSHPREIIT